MKLWMRTFAPARALLLGAVALAEDMALPETIEAAGEKCCSGTMTAAR